MRMYSLYEGKNFLGKYVRKEQAVSDILDIYQLEAVDDRVKIYMDEDRNEWVIVRGNKVLSRFSIKVEEV